MTPSQDCIDLIKKWEGLRLKAYQDQKGIWTIGYGSTGPGIDQHTEWSQSLANLALITRINALGGLVLHAIAPHISQNQLDALVSLVYNIGIGAFKGSTLLRKINGRDFEGAAGELVKWDHINGVVSQGLLNRRLEERALFLGDKP